MVRNLQPAQEDPRLLRGAQERRAPEQERKGLMSDVDHVTKTQFYKALFHNTKAASGQLTKVATEHHTHHTTNTANSC